MFVRAAARAAPRELAVNEDGGHAANSMLLCLGSYIGLVHVVNDYLVRGTSYALDELNCLLARRTASAKDFDFLPRCDIFPPLNAF